MYIFELDPFELLRIKRAANSSIHGMVGECYSKGHHDSAGYRRRESKEFHVDGLERLAIRTTQNMAPAGTTHYVYGEMPLRVLSLAVGSAGAQ